MSGRGLPPGLYRIEARPKIDRRVTSDSQADRYSSSRATRAALVYSFEFRILPGSRGSCTSKSSSPVARIATLVPVHKHSRPSQRGQDADLLGTDQPPRRHHDSPVDILAGWSNMRPPAQQIAPLSLRRRQTRLLGPVKITRVLIGSHSISTIRQRCAGHDPDRSSRLKSLTRLYPAATLPSTARPTGEVGVASRNVRRTDSIAIHGRVVKGRNGSIGDNLLRQHPSLASRMDTCSAPTAGRDSGSWLALRQRLSTQTLHIVSVKASQPRSPCRIACKPSTRPA